MSNQATDSQLTAPISNLEAFVKERPIIAIGGAVVAGVFLGGVLFSRAARLVCVAAATALAVDVWQREGRIDARGVIERLTPRRAPGKSSGGASTRA